MPPLTKKEEYLLAYGSAEDFYSYLYPHGTLRRSEPTVNNPADIVGVRNDYWNLYAYGDEVKIVYFKQGIIHHKPRRAQAFRAPKDTSANADNARFAQSISRSKARVFEIAMCNEFTYFCTFTQDQKKRNRFDITEFRKDFAMFVRNLNRTRSEEQKIRYLLVPEKHQNGAWHMHGLLMGLTDSDLRLFTLSEKLPQSIRKQLKSGEKVYNWDKYQGKFGYFTCTEIKEQSACARYITKYICKDLSKGVRECGAHLYFASQGLKGREVVVKHSFDECPVSDEWDFENDYIKIKTIKLS